MYARSVSETLHKDDLFEGELGYFTHSHGEVL